MPDAPRAGLAEPVITDEQRNGSIAGIALLLGFSLSFTAAWTQGSDPWTARSPVTFAIAVIGNVLQLRALLMIFSLPNISVAAHRRAGALFLSGVVTVLVGYLLHVSLDAAGDFGLF
jgi:hypothetical protein